MAFKCLIKKQDNKPVSLKDFAARRNKILIRRRVGGLGDILMHRMIFSSFRDIMPEIELTFGCPPQYVESVADHPALNAVVDYTLLKREDFGMIYDTTTRCRVYEAMTAPNCTVHRSDIWANSCGVAVADHDMHVVVPSDYLAEAKKLLGEGPPTVLFVPVSNAGREKNLTDEQTRSVIRGLKSRGVRVVGLHQERQLIFEQEGAVSFPTHCLKTWKAIIAAVDYVVTIDTAAFHMAGGLRKPMVGIFSWTDGKIYGKYFKYFLVQKHKDDDKTWCGPCLNWEICPKAAHHEVKPCVTELDCNDILAAFDRLRSCGGGRVELSVVRHPHG